MYLQQRLRFALTLTFRSLSSSVQSSEKVKTSKEKSPTKISNDKSAKKVSKELKVHVGTQQFKPKAIERTTETKNMVQNLPDSLKIKVESTSSILENIKNDKGA